MALGAAGGGGLMAAAGAASGASEAASPTPTADYVNPLILQRADPHITRHTDDLYYFTATAPEYDRIVLRRAETLQGLGTAEESVIWRKHDTGEMGAHIWAPELHFVDGAWYIYFAAGRAEDVWAIRPYVLENTSADPFTGTWTERGRIATAWDTFSLDATTFEHGGTRYLCWAQANPEHDNNSSIFLSAMDSPWTLTGPQVELSVPEYDWEIIGYRVNEGPYALKRSGRIFLTYSASATDANYCVGMLTAAEDSDLLDPASWSKSPEPVFATSDANGQYGPGHNCFTVSDDGTEDVLVYHARQYRDIEGDPLNDPNRHTRIQTFTWNADGTPDFGEPVPDSATRGGEAR
jgi:GH43 family beta-xylosidase